MSDTDHKPSISSDDRRGPRTEAEPRAETGPRAPSGADALLLRRLAALVYDLLLLAGLLFIATLIVFLLRGGRSVAPGTLWFQLLLVGVVVGFFTWFWTHGGQTLGLRAWKLRVVDSRGGAVRWSSALVRFFAGLLAALPAGLGFWWAAFDRDGLGWHDRLSRTRVERAPRDGAAGATASA